MFGACTLQCGQHALTWRVTPPLRACAVEQHKPHVPIKAHKTIFVNQKLIRHCIIREYISRGLQTWTTHPERITLRRPACSSSGERALRQSPVALRLPLKTWTTQLLPKWDLIWTPGTRVCYLPILSCDIVTDCFCYCVWLIVSDWDWTCINKSWLNSIVTCVDSLLFLGLVLSIGLVASQVAGRLQSMRKGGRLTYGKDYSTNTHKVRVSLTTARETKSTLS